MNKIKNASLVLGALSVTSNSVFVPINSLAKEKELFTEKKQEKTEDSTDKYSINWNAQIGVDKEDKFYEIVQTKDGGIIAVGQTALTPTSGLTTGDAIIVKFDENGEEEWREVLSGDETDRYYSVVEISGGYIAFGTSYSTDLEFENTSRDGNAIISKYDTNGKEVWTKNFRDGSNPIAFKNAVALPDGSVIAVCGKIQPNIGGGAIEKDNINTRSLVKFSPNGDVIWEKLYNDDSEETVVTDIKIASDGSILLAGYIYSATDKNDTYYVVAKIDEEGEEIWHTKEKNAGTSSAHALAEGLDGNIYVVGEFVQPTKTGTTDAIIINLDGENGEQKWSNTIKGDKFDSFESVSVNSKGEIIAVGHSDSSLDGTSINGKKEVIVAKYGENSTMSDIANLGPDTQGLVVNSSFLDSEDNLIIAGKMGKNTGDTPCDLVNPCVQFDAVLLSVKENLKAPVIPPDCTVNPPVLTGDDITINVGDKINPLDYVTIEDPTLQDLIKLIDFTTNLKGGNEEFFGDKPGEYYINYEVENECGIKGELSIKVTVKEPSCTVVPADVVVKDKKLIFYIGDSKVDYSKSIEIRGAKSDKVKDVKVSTENGTTITTTTLENDEILIVQDNIDITKEGTYKVQVSFENECNKDSDEFSVIVKKKTTEDSNGGTSKPQTGDNATVYTGLAIASIAGLIVLNKKNNKKDIQDDTEIQE